MAEPELEEELQKYKRRNAYLLVLVLLLLGINVLQFGVSFLGNKKLAKTEAARDSTSHELDMAQTGLDSLRQEVDSRIAEVQKLGGDTAKLGQIRHELMADLAQARRTGRTDKRRIAELREKVAAYAEQLEEKDLQITTLKTERQKLFKYNRELETDVAKNKDSVRAMAAEKTALAEKVANASVLKAERIAITYLDSKGRERDDEVLRAKRLTTLKIAMTLAENNLAEPGARDFYLRLLEPDALPTPSTEGGTFTTADGREVPYVQKQTILYQNGRPDVTFTFNRASGRWREGLYIYEIWTEGRKIGGGTVKVD